MPRVAVVSDSGCSLPDSLRDQHGIGVVPFVTHFGTEAYLDGEISEDEFWEKVRGGGPHPETSQPSPGMFEEAFAPLVVRGDHVICLTTTSRHSGAYNSARLAASTFPGRVTVFDTLSASAAQGQQVIVAAKAAAQGRSPEDILALLESVRVRSRFWAALDTIEYLRRGGRIDHIMPVLARLFRAFDVKLLLGLVDGEIKPLGVARSRQKSMRQLMDRVAALAPLEMLGVAHTRQPHEASHFAQALADRLGFAVEEVTVAEVGPAFSTHLGPGVMAVGAVRSSTP